jgi:hypothetical protein
LLVNAAICTTESINSETTELADICLSGHWRALDTDAYSGRVAVLIELEDEMAIVKRQFYKNHKPQGDEYWFYLARDTETGEVFVIREFDYLADGGSEKKMTLYEFLAGGGNRQNALLELIGSLVPDDRLISFPKR